MFYTANIYATENFNDPESLTDIILDVLYENLTTPNFYPADDPDDEGLYFNAAPYGNEFGADDIFSVGIVTDDGIDAVETALEKVLELNDVFAYDIAVS